MYVKDSDNYDTKKDKHNSIICNDDDVEGRPLLGGGELWKAQNIHIIGNKPVVKKEEEKKKMDGITTTTVITATSSKKPLPNDDTADHPLYILDHFGLLWTITKEDINEAS